MILSIQVGINSPNNLFVGADIELKVRAELIAEFGLEIRARSKAGP